MRDAQDRLFKSYQTQDLFVPEGSQSAVTTSITRLNEDQVASAGRRIVLDAALQQVAQMQSSGQSLDSVPQVAADALYLGLSGQVAALNQELTRLLEKYKSGAPRRAEGRGADRAAQEGARRAGHPARARDARGAGAAASAARPRSAAPSTPRRPRPPPRAARAPSSTRCARRRSPPRTSTRSCSRSSTKATSRPPSARTT